jgi:Aldo/keto reductase family
LSALALGTLTFGHETTEADSFAQLDRFVSAGGTLIDTADVYAEARSEQTSAAGRPPGRTRDDRDQGPLPQHRGPNGQLDETSGPGAPDYP